RISRTEHFIGVIEHRAGDLRTPAAGFREPDSTVHRAAADAGGSDAAATEAILPLKLRQPTHVIERHRTPERIPRGAGFSFFRRDQHDALTGSRSVDGARRRALQNLDTFNVVRIDIDG